MALYIEYMEETKYGRTPKVTRWVEWHIGEPTPDFGRVVKFQADGDELNLITEAMAASRGEHPRVEYRKMQGFTAKVPHSLEDPYGLIAATLILANGRRINLSQRALDLLEEHRSTLFQMPPLR